MGEYVNSYKINNKIVNMLPLYKTLTYTSEKFKIDYQDTADITINCSQELYDKFYKIHNHLTFDEIERILTSMQFNRYIMDYNSIMLHASAIVYKDFAYLFSGKSQVGKTTHTKMWQKYFPKEDIVILNDDKPVINTNEGNVLAYGTPWSGNSIECESMAVPIGSIVFLEQGSYNKLVKLENTNQILPLLLEQTVHKVSECNMNKILDTIGIIVNECNFYKLICNTSIDAVEESKKIIL